ncbi:MAG TPA: septum site-determining protein MinD [Clostridiales bacterium]|nr:septum site-determining protein MinD [Clostridiales bacterium]
MSKVIAITSGKGGTGKSSICSGLGYSLAKMGNRTLIIELDFGLRCIDIIFGMSAEIKQDLGTVLEGKCDAIDAITQVKVASNLNILCAPKNPFTVVTAEQITDICQEVKKFFDYIIIDTGAGINSHVFDIVEQSNLILVITTPDPICVRDARMMSDEFYKRGNQRQRLIINKVSKRTITNEIVKDLDEIIDTIGVQLIGVVPEDNELIIATGKGFPLSYEAPSLIAFDAIARRIKGEDIPLTLKLL